VHKLTEIEARKAAPRDKAYKLFDGGGLFLLVQPDGAKYWRMNYRLGGRHGTAALGVYLGKGAGKVEVSLAEARRQAGEVRRLLAAGIDPAAHRRAQAARTALEAQELADQVASRREAARARRQAERAARAVARNTFEAVAEQWIAERRAHWSAAHAHQVEQSFRDHVYPTIGARPIAELGSGDALDVLSDLLAAGKAETARRVKQRMVGVWRYAVLRGLAASDVVTLGTSEFSERKRLALKANPRRSFAAVSPAELPELLRAMRAYSGSDVVRLGLRLLALTLVRTGELRGALWSELTLEGDAPSWVIPPERMKIKTRGDRAAGAHVVPLSRQAVAAFLDVRALGLDGVRIMPHARKAGATISENAFLYALAGLGYKGRMTGHGFRAVGSTVLHEAGFAHELIEAQLAHEQADDVARRYNRAEYLDRRREMLQWYADALDRMERGEPAKVLMLRRP
jgi:integrase